MKKLLITLVLVTAISLSACEPSKAPSLNLPEIKTAKMYDKYALYGKTTVLVFWYPSCPACGQAMPRLVQFHQQNAPNPNFQTIAISLNVNTEAEVMAYTQKYQLPFGVAYDKDRKVAYAYNIKYAPTVYLINNKRKIVKKYIGEPDWNELKQQVDKLLK